MSSCPQAPKSIEELAIISEDESNAKLQAKIRLPRRRLDVRVRVSIVDHTPPMRRYSFHYMTDDRSTMFRYDNSGHYPGLSNSPHHKHEGLEEVIIGCPQPSIHAIRDEIAAFLE